MDRRRTKKGPNTDPEAVDSGKCIYMYSGRDRRSVDGAEANTKRSMKNGI